MDILYITLINTITSTIVTSITRTIDIVFQNVGNPWDLFKKNLYDFIFGQRCEYTENRVTWGASDTFSVGNEIIKYIEEKTGKKCCRLSYDNTNEKVIANDHTFGNINIGYKVSSSSLSEHSSLRNMTMTFYSRYHTVDTFSTLVADLKKRATNRITANVFAMRKPGNPSIIKFFTREHLTKPKIHSAITADIVKKMDAGTARNFLLYGPPGTGKTTVISQVADHYDACVFISKLSHFESIYDMYDFFLDRAYSGYDDESNDVTCFPKTKIFIFEDFNTMMPASFWKGRGDDDLSLLSLMSSKSKDGGSDEGCEGKAAKDTSTSSSYYQPRAELTYSELLNILDGVIPMNGVYTFWTTNHIEDINESFTRNGRMCKLHVDRLDATETAEILGVSISEAKRLYPSGARVSDLKA